MFLSDTKSMERRGNTSFQRLSALVLLWLLPGSPLTATAQDAVPTTDSTVILRKELEGKRMNAGRMERMVRALNEVDSVYKWRYPTWIVLDEDMSERIRRSFRVRKITFPADSAVQVIANPSTDEILEISIGAARMGRNETRVFLSDSLHNAILEGNYVRRTVDPREQQRRVAPLYGEHPRFAAAYGSAFGAGLMVSNGWGVEGKMGFEEIGYHFWSTGSIRAMGVFDQLKIGVVIPIVQGTTETSNQPLDIRPRKMTGVIGVATEFQVPWEDQSVNFLLSVGDVPKVTNYRLLTDSVRFYFLHTVAQGTYTRHLELDQGHRLTLVGGLGYHQMALGEVRSDQTVQTVSKEDFISPVLRIEYLNRVANMFGVSAQLYSSIVHLKGWVEIVRNLLYIDLQYYSPVFREPKPWEQPYFFMISPRIQVIF
jgi:hypothetical protein